MSNTTDPLEQATDHLRAVRDQLLKHHAARMPSGSVELNLDVGLDADLLAAFNRGARQSLVLQIQTVRLLRRLVERDEG